MRVLTLTQPWATLVAIGAKTIETRSWATNYRGPIAIHAGAGLGPVGGAKGLNNLVMDGGPFFAALHDAITVAPRVLNTDHLPRGAIVAVAELIECVYTDSLTYEPRHIPHTPDPRLTDQERAFGDYSPGRYAWLLADVRPLRTPLPYRGGLGLRMLDDLTIASIEDRL